MVIRMTEVQTTGGNAGGKKPAGHKYKVLAAAVIGAAAMGAMMGWAHCNGKKSLEQDLKNCAVQLEGCAKVANEHAKEPKVGDGKCNLANNEVAYVFRWTQAKPAPESAKEAAPATSDSDASAPVSSSSDSDAMASPSNGYVTFDVPAALATMDKGPRLYLSPDDCGVCGNGKQEPGETKDNCIIDFTVVCGDSLRTTVTLKATPGRQPSLSAPLYTVTDVDPSKKGKKTTRDVTGPLLYYEVKESNGKATYTAKVAGNIDECADKNADGTKNQFYCEVDCDSSKKPDAGVADARQPIPDGGLPPIDAEPPPPVDAAPPPPVDAGSLPVHPCSSQLQQSSKAEEVKSALSAAVVGASGNLQQKIPQIKTVLFSISVDVNGKPRATSATPQCGGKCDEGTPGNVLGIISPDLTGIGTMGEDINCYYSVSRKVTK